MINQCKVLKQQIKQIYKLNECSQKKMKSLRTDDIIGAMPRVRHMPKNLYRQHQSYPYTHSQEQFPIKDYDSYYKALGGKWDHSYNSNIYGNFPLSQYDPNPFLKQTNPHQNSLDQVRIRPQQHRQSQYQGIYQKPGSFKLDQTKIHKENQPRAKNMKQKQALLINYEQLKHLQNLPKKNSRESGKKTYRPDQQSNLINQNPETINQNIHRNKSDSKREVNSNVNSSIQRQNRSSHSHHNSTHIHHNSSQSVRSSQSKERGDKNIFRGLGFNIITNSKYSYNVQSSLPYTRREN